MKPAHIIITLIIAATVVACSKTPRGVLSPDKMSELLADVYRSEAAIDFNSANYAGDSMKMTVKQSVFLAHGITQADFDSSLVWYGHHIEEYLKVCDKAIALLEDKLKGIPDDESGLNQMLVAGDSASVWPRERFYHITQASPSRFVTFRLLPDDNWESGDNYSLEFKLMNGRSPVKSAIAVNYADGGTEWKNITREEEGWSRVGLVLDSTRTAAEIYGLLEFKPTAGEHIYVDSISLIRTRRQPNGHRTAVSRPSKFEYGRVQK